MGQIATRARSLRERAIELAQRELHAYEPVLAVLQMPKADPDRAAKLDAALSEAAESPLALARVCAEVTALALEASRGGSPHLRGDALAGLLIAEGAMPGGRAAGRDQPRRPVRRRAAARADGGGRNGRREPRAQQRTPKSSVNVAPRAWRMPG